MSTNNHKIVRCPVCQSMRVRPHLIVARGAEILICGNCRNAFTCPPPEIPDYQNEDFQARNGDGDTLTRLKDLPIEISESYSAQLEMIAKRITVGSSVLEIGGGEGIFLEMVSNAGYSTRLVEPSIAAANRAKKRGINVINDYFSPDIFDQKFDLICMGHVLEHVPSPVEFIEGVKTRLFRNGYILLTQTNYEGLMPRLLKGNWYAWVPHQHFTHFSIPGLKYLAEKTELQVIEFRHSRLVHGASALDRVLRYIPFLQDQIHVLMRWS